MTPDNSTTADSLEGSPPGHEIPDHALLPPITPRARALVMALCMTRGEPAAAAAMWERVYRHGDYDVVAAALVELVTELAERLAEAEGRDGVDYLSDLVCEIYLVDD